MSRWQGILDGLSDEELSPTRPAWILAALVVLALALRFMLYRYHHIIEGDGVHYVSLAKFIYQNGSLKGAANAYWSNLWPLIIAAFGLLAHNLELAGRLASTIFGALLVLPVYLICREFLNTRTSLAAASLVPAQPYLLQFSVLLFTESIYTFLLAWVLWLGIRLIKSPDRTERWLWLGLLTGAGLWTRPEIQAPALLLTIISLVRCIPRATLFKKALRGAALFAGVVLVFLFARAVLIHHYSGAWHFGFGGKMAVNLREGPIYYTDHGKYINKFENGRFVNLQPEKRGLLPFLWENKGRLYGRIKSNGTRIVRAYAEVLGPTKGIDLLRKTGFGLIFLGVLGTLLKRETRGWALLLIVIGVSYSIPWLFIFIVDRFVVPLAAVSIIFAGAGLLILDSCIAVALRRRRAAVWPVLSSLIVLAFLMRTATWSRHDRYFVWASDPVVQKEAGLYLKCHFPQETKILVEGPHIPYYFYEGDPYKLSVQQIPYASYKEVIDFARRQKVDLLVLPEWVLLGSDFPIKDLTTDGVRAKGIRLISVVGQQGPWRVWIYRILPRRGFRSPRPRPREASPGLIRRIGAGWNWPLSDRDSAKFEGPNPWEWQDHHPGSAQLPADEPRWR